MPIDPELAAGPMQHSAAVACFERLMLEEEEELELALTLKLLCAKVASPFSAVRNEGLEKLLSFLHTLPPTSARQETLTGNFMKDLFYRTFPRRELSLAFVNGIQIRKMEHREALRWTTLPSSNQDTAGPATGAERVAAVLRDVTLFQQELAMRCVQGLCTLFPSQREVVQETPLLPIVIEAVGTCYVYLEAHFHERQKGERATAHAQDKGSSDARCGPVAMDPSLEALLIAMVDAVEAACFYNPKAIGQFCSLHGVRHFMRLACAPFVPHPLRGAILDMISLVMQQVEPFTSAHLQQLRQRQVAEADLGGQSPHVVPPQVREASDEGQRWVGGPAGDAAPHARKAAHLHNDPAFYSNTPSPSRANAFPEDGEVPDRLPLIDRASASKFDNAVRDWLREHGLTTVAQQLLRFKDISGAMIPREATRQEAVRIAQRLNREREKAFNDLLAAIDSKIGVLT